MTAKFSLEFVTDEKTQENAPIGVILSLSGAWVVANLSGMTQKLKKALRQYNVLRLETASLEKIDTAGALLLQRVLKDRLQETPFQDQEDFAAVFKLVDCHKEIEVIETKKFSLLSQITEPIISGLDRFGRLIIAIFEKFYEHLVFLGHTMSALFMCILVPKRLRFAPLFSLMQRAGLEAAGIVILTNFFIGSVVAFLGVLALQDFGGGIFAVELIGMSVLREFAPVITATFMAGRSASSFAAEIGVMKMRQEIDAMKVMGIDPFDALVVPRFLSMIIMMPLITFLGALAGLLGGALVVWGVLDFGIPFFFRRMLDYVPLDALLVGMIKTPFFAATIAVVGCHLGMMVKSDVVSLGRNVTTAVVHATFLIFMENALFAILFRDFKL